MRRMLAPVAVLLLAGCGRSHPSSGDSVAHGAQIVRYPLHSKLVGQDLNQVAILPARAVRPPLLVFLHGRGSGQEESNVNPAFLAALAKLGDRAPAVVFPSGGDHSYWHDRADGRWGSYVVREVIPAAVRRLHADPHRVAIGGISMGGFGAYDIARLNPRRFCAVGGHSAATWLTGGQSPPGAFDDGEDFARHDVIHAARPGEYGRASLWLDDGDHDPFLNADAELARRLGIKILVWPGGHETTYWRAHYVSYLTFYARALARCGD